MSIDLDIRIYKSDTGYLVTAQGPATGLARARLDDAALRHPDFVEKLRQVREEPFTTNQDLFRQIGDVLFAALFRGRVQDLFFALYRQARAEKTSLRLRLHVDEGAIELATLPWEFLHRGDVFLATQITTLVIRQLLDLEFGDVVSLTVARRPRVLIVIPDAADLDTAREEAAITQALDAAYLPYDVLKGQVTRQALDDALARKPYAILHFIGHGAFSKDAAGRLRGRLRLNAASNDRPARPMDEDWISEVELQSLLGNSPSLKLVVLNGCEVGAVARRPGGEGFWGVAPALLRAGIPAVIAMQYPIRDDVAIQFAETFYRRLCSGQWAGHVDIAVTLARNACFLAYPDDRGFATPVLYLRAANGVIFDFASPITPSTAAGVCEETPRPPDHLLYRYRNAETSTLIDRYHLLHSRLQRILLQIDHLASAPSGQDGGRLHRYKRNRDRLEREMDELADVLRWRAFLLCQELRDLRAKLAEKEARRDALEDEGKYVSYDLKNDIFALHERILGIEDLIEEIDEVAGPAPAL